MSEEQNISIDAVVKESYLPNRRCRKPRTRGVVRTLTVHVRTPDDMPLAYRVHGTKWTRSGTTEETVTEIRVLDGKAYRPVKDYRGDGDGDALRMVRDRIESAVRQNEWSGEGFDETASVILGDDGDDRTTMAQTEADLYALFDGRAWRRCDWPVYVITRSWNHLSLSINSGIPVSVPPEDVFDARHRRDALRRMDDISTGRCFRAARRLWRTTGKASKSWTMPSAARTLPRRI